MTSVLDCTALVSDPCVHFTTANNKQLEGFDEGYTTTYNGDLNIPLIFVGSSCESFLCPANDR